MFPNPSRHSFHQANHIPHRAVFAEAQSARGTHSDAESCHESSWRADEASAAARRRHGRSSHVTASVRGSAPEAAKDGPGAQEVITIVFAPCAYVCVCVCVYLGADVADLMSPSPWSVCDDSKLTGRHRICGAQGD